MRAISVSTGFCCVSREGLDFRRLSKQQNHPRRRILWAFIPRKHEQRPRCIRKSETLPTVREISAAYGR